MTAKIRSLKDLKGKLDFDNILEKASKVGSAYNNYKMEKALLEEQRDRTSVETGIYVPGPDDAKHGPVEDGGGGIQIGGMNVQPMHLAIAGAALLVLVIA